MSLEINKSGASGAGSLAFSKNRALWVDSVNGSDTTGNGSFAKPFAGLEAAMGAVVSPTSVSPWTIYLIDGEHPALSNTFQFLPNVFIYGLSSKPTVVQRADNMEVENNGGAGDYVFNNINFSAGLKISVPALSNVTMSDCASGGLIAFFTLVCGADVAGSLAGKYFLFDAPLVKYYIWYRVSGSGVDPLIANRTGIVVDIATNDTAASVATKTNTALSSSAQRRQWNFDFTTTVPTSGSVRVTPGCGVGSVNLDAGDTGFTVTPPSSPNRGIQLLGTDQNNRIVIDIKNTIANACVFFKNCTGNVLNSSFGNVMIDYGLVSPSRSITIENSAATTVQVRGFGTVTKFAGSQPSSSTNGFRIINRVSGFPLLTLNSQNSIGTQRRDCSIVNGSDILTMSSSLKTQLPVGTHIISTGIPANTFIGDSVDLPNTEIRMVDTNGAPVLATQTRTNVSVSFRRVTFQNGALATQLLISPEANSILYVADTVSHWPNSVSPSNVSIALDSLASKRSAKEQFTITATEIANQYVDLSNNYLASSVVVELRKSASPTVLNSGAEGTGYEYTLTTYLDANNTEKTRLVFDTNWGTGGASEIVANDVLHVQGITQDDNY